MIGTTRDPATPYQWAVALAEMLDSAVLLTRDGDGHTGFQAGNACVDTTVEGYLTGTLTLAAPIACWIAGQTDLSAAELMEAAKRAGRE